MPLPDRNPQLELRATDDQHEVPHTCVFRDTLTASLCRSRRPAATKAKMMEPCRVIGATSNTEFPRSPSR